MKPVKDTLCRTLKTQDTVTYIARIRKERGGKAKVIGTVHSREALEALYKEAFDLLEKGVAWEDLPTRVRKEPGKITAGGYSLTRPQWFEAFGASSQALYESAARKGLTLEQEIQRRAALLDPEELAERIRDPKEFKGTKPKLKALIV
jgi:hypothetical protein